MKKLIATNFLFVVCLLLGCQNKPHYRFFEGNVFGTYYKITIETDELKFPASAIDSIFEQINQSINSYRPNSLISQFNQGKLVELDEVFLYNFELSKTIYKATNGYFNPAVQPLIEAYQFSDEVDFQQIRPLIDLNQINPIKKKEAFYLQGDGQKKLVLNAIGKGYALDALSAFFTQHNEPNHLIEIGGEVKASGTKNKKPWKIGIEYPSLEKNDLLIAHVRLTNQAIATAGSYRQFITKKGENKWFSHIVNPTNGDIQIRELVSVSVILPDCASADAYSTALMAMGKEQAVEFVQKNKHIPVFFIYNETDKLSFQTFNLQENGIVLDLNQP